MSLKQTSETVNAKHRIAQIITQWVPGSRASDSKYPTPKGLAYKQLTIGWGVWGIHANNYVYIFEVFSLWYGVIY